MIPICRDTGSVIAFGGRALDADQQPKYLNSPETPIYTKSRTLYGLNLTKAAIRQGGFAVLVEGYFDFAQVFQAEAAPVVASCGTALTPQQAQLLRRFTAKVVLSFDPDAAGQGAAARSCELLVAEGFDVNVVVLRPGRRSRYVHPEARAASGTVNDCAARGRIWSTCSIGRRPASTSDTTTAGVQFLAEMLAVAARIPDAAARDQFADRLAHKARVTEEVVRAEIRKAAVSRQTDAHGQRELPSFGQVTKAEKGLIWWLIHEPGRGPGGPGRRWIERIWSGLAAGRCWIWRGT